MVARIGDDVLSELLGFAMVETHKRPRNAEEAARWRAIVRALIELQEMRAFVVKNVVQPGRAVYPVDILESRPMAYLPATVIAEARELMGREVKTGSLDWVDGQRVQP